MLWAPHEAYAKLCEPTAPHDAPFVYDTPGPAAITGDGDKNWPAAPAAPLEVGGPDPVVGTKLACCRVMTLMGSGAVTGEEADIVPPTPWQAGCATSPYALP